MKITACIAFAVSALASAATMAQDAAQAPAKPILKTTCADYVALDETIKPRFIYYVVGHAQNGRKEGDNISAILASKDAENDIGNGFFVAAHALPLTVEAFVRL